MNQPSDRADDAAQQAFLLALERGLDPLKEGHRFAFNKAREIRRSEAHRDRREQLYVGSRVVSTLGESFTGTIRKNWLRSLSSEQRRQFSAAGHKAKADKAIVRQARIAELLLCGATLAMAARIVGVSINAAWKAGKVLLDRTVYRPRRGFANMPREKVQKIAQKGGRLSNGHRYSAYEAKINGQLGGQKISANRAYMAAIGRKGGMGRSKKRRSYSVREADGCYLSADARI